MEKLSFVIKGDEKEGPTRENDEIMRALHECITTLQKIKFICQRAKKTYIEEKDIDDILKLLEGKV
ncbi:hypothetical protein [Bacillus haynesii]|uniref:hypothetical protein n=1 Tax=Bacillus haynesii TaxID=1925021 RepID=UPI00227EA136|nr:hypothetical protein [Bacillus haynesii]MCY7789870.1 hypothetical protein [Bacillus haynesii]MCY8074251.1 hypothetical protein [Bacillus haynesii]MCY8383179.1 hypothetical protein [Bacillus haynesii]MCY8539709.1 hypothetical protein [Bacillus haynesii]MCY8548674.1 hypothetical protein [Bacillus haynesii]